jgi:GT2 family glycosyltransferase
MSEGEASEEGRRSNSVVVIVVSFRRPDDIAACLASLQSSSLTTFEVVVVENGGAAAFCRLQSALSAKYGTRPDAKSSAGSVADPNRVQGARLRWDRAFLPGGQSVLLIDAGDNLGYGGAINLAFDCMDKGRTWRGVWILNPDTQPEPSALEILVSYAEQEGFGLVGSRLVDSVHKTIQMRGGARLRPLIGRSIAFGYGEPANSPANTVEIKQRLAWISGAATYATRDFIEAVGPMNDRYFLYWEDVDWSLRRGPFRLGYAHDAVVLHVGGTSTRAVTGSRSDLTVYLSERNRLLLTREHFPLIYPLTAMAACLSLIEYILRGEFHAFVVGWRGWLAGVRGETGRPERLLQQFI